MKKVILTITAAIAMQGITIAQSKSEIESDSLKNSKSRELEQFVVKSTRVNENAPVAHENMSKEDIEKNNQGVDLPILLDQQTSVVTTSDAGAGVGYTGIRIRGSDASRINVTVNGIPINDSESQGTFWVNMPDLASSASDIQIQRGVGTSSNGAGAFGASININTLESNPLAYGVISNSFGSFNTMRNSLQFGTGLIDNKFVFDGRLSNIQSQGYIDRAASDLKSYYLAGAYIGEKSMLKAVTFSGHERTYQAWYGVPTTYMDTNRTFNPYNYENEVDDYQQSHYQLHYVYNANPHFKLNAAMHYTRGLGFFEQYKGADQNSEINYFSKESLSDYGLNDVITSSGDTIAETELIRRRWLDNHFYGAIMSAEYTTDKMSLVLGGGANQYIGEHYGEIIWAEYASNGDLGHRYYENDASKNDFNVYAKLNYKFNDKLSILGDLQGRMISYSFLGFDNELSNVTQTINLTFFNPKAGVNYALNNNQSVYGFLGIGNKEPNRNDYTNSTPVSRPQHEQMLDFEAGYRVRNSKFFATVNVYAMEYSNQLIVTGELNDVGSAIRQNVPVSYRRGIEMNGGVQLHEKVQWSLNATLSTNKIEQFNEYVDDWDTQSQIEVIHQNTDIAFSPSIIAGSQLAYTPIKTVKGELELAFITKYVGDQYIDNTQSEFAKLSGYVVNDARVTYKVKSKLFKEICINAWVRNLFNEQYVANAWNYRFQSSGGSYGDIYETPEGEGTDRYSLTGLFPQAGTNFFLGLTLKF
ncbi:MAG: iron complex outermembrane receptor protein [Parvicella sp.]|jgi:iron complex outermembrane receptor protein